MSDSLLQSTANTLGYYLPLITPYLALLALLLASMAFVMNLLLQKRLKRLALGRSGSLEETISILSRESKDMKIFRSEVEKYLTLTEQRLRGSVQGVGVVRFNPFANGQGGNQSFACALLDERGNGVVLSTLYARDRVGVYAKPLTQGASSFELTEEEKEAIAKARNSIAQHKK
jgi:hypothetical protein